MKRLLVTIALGATVVSAPVLAQSQPQARGGGGFMQRDQTRQEAQQRTDMLFQMLDANHDGTVTRAEADQALAKFQAARGDDNNGRRGNRMQRMIEQAFATSQSLTLQQFEAQSLARFDAADLNHDGTVTAAERQQARGQQGTPVPQSAAPQGASGKPQ
jgi:Ca2+-binding EF-hand superfamily protein